MRTTDVDFFYGSAENNFWKDLSIIYNTSLLQQNTKEAVDQRIALLTKLRLGITDIIASAFTTGGATDTALQNIELNKKLLHMLDDVPTISTLYFTSGSGKVNAEGLTLQLLKESGRISNMQINQKTSPRQRQFVYRSQKGAPRIVKAVTLYSPSPLAEQWSGVTAEGRREQYEAHLPKI